MVEIYSPANGLAPLWQLPVHVRRSTSVNSCPEITQIRRSKIQSNLQANNPASDPHEANLNWFLPSR